MSIFKILLSVTIFSFSTDGWHLAASNIFLKFHLDRTDLLFHFTYDPFSCFSIFLSFSIISFLDSPINHYLLRLLPFLLLWHDDALIEGLIVVVSCGKIFLELFNQLIAALVDDEAIGSNGVTLNRFSSFSLAIFNIKESTASTSFSFYRVKKADTAVSFSKVSFAFSL